MSDQTPVPHRAPGRLEDQGSSTSSEATGPGLPSPSTEPSTAPPAVPAKPRAMRGSVKSMIISMVVVVAGVLVWLAMVPRVSSVTQPTVDVAGIARAHSQAQKWDLAIAQGLPNDWQPTNVHLLRPGQGPVTWQAGYTGPSQAYVAVLQTRDGSASWVADQISSGTTSGTVTIHGVTWTKYVHLSNDQRSLVRSSPLAGLTTVVTGTADWNQLTTFAKDLVPYSRSAAAKRGPNATP